MGKEFLKFGFIETERLMFHSSKSTIDIGYVNTDKTIIFDRHPCAKEDSKCFIGSRNNEEVTQLCVFLPKMVSRPCLFHSKMHNY